MLTQYRYYVIILLHHGRTDMTPSRAQNWQKDSNSINASRVQVWSDEGVMIGLKSKEWAIESVKSQKVFVISDQAVGYYG